jgi:hypothetical protein
MHAFAHPTGKEYCVFGAPLTSMLIASLKLRLKVVGNEKGGGLGGWLLSEDGFGPCDRRLFCKDQLIGDWYENRRGAPLNMLKLASTKNPVNRQHRVPTPRLHVVKAGRNHLNEEITPSSPLG